MKPGYKQTEMGVIPKEWEVRFLPEVLRFRGGKAHEQHVSENGRYVCVNSKFISTDGKVRKYSTANFCAAKTGDILMVMSDLPNGRALAKAYLVEANDIYAVNQRICALTVYRDCPEYFFYVLNRHPYFLKFDDGVSQTHLLNHVFLKCPIPVPPRVAEQRAIATALSDVDALLGALDRLIAKKRDLKQAAMQQLLTGKTRLPGFHGEWVVKRLDEIALLYQSVTISANHFTESGYPVYGANGVVGFYHSPNHRTWQVTVTCRGSTCGTVNRTVDECWITGNAMVLSCDHNRSMDKGFFYFLMLGQNLTDCITGTGQPQIVRSPLAAFRVRLPPLPEQTAIAEVLSGMDAELAALERRGEKTRALKQGIMQELLTGRTRLV